jgi:hypothetical protein
MIDKFKIKVMHVDIENIDKHYTIFLNFKVQNPVYARFSLIML